MDIDLEVYKRYSRGVCPCCGGEFTSYPDNDGDLVQPEVVAEGVRFCGRCILNKHHLGPEGFLQELLENIAKGAECATRSRNLHL